MTKVRILEGTYRLRGTDVDMSGKVFTLAKAFSVGKNGGYVTVDSTDVPGLPDRNIRIFCESAHCVEEVSDDEADRPVFQKPVIVERTDEEIMEEMRDRFSMLNDMTRAVKRGDVKAMIVSGPPGVGKSHGVEDVLGRYDTHAYLSGEEPKYQFVKGNMSPVGLYCKLYEFKEKDNVLVFDDCDAVFDDPLSLNLLKAALDSKAVRKIHWNTDSHKLRLEDIPHHFQFEGSVIFITNLNLSEVKSNKLREHLKALESRCHYMDLSINTEREKMLRIKQVVGDGMLNSVGLDEGVKERIMEFVETNQPKLRELSLRTVCKIADLAKAFPDKWEKMAEYTVLR